MIGNVPAISRLNFSTNLRQGSLHTNHWELIGIVACAIACGAAEAQFSKLENYLGQRSGRVVRRPEMLLTAPDSVKIFIIVLLLQSLVCALGRLSSGSGDGCLWQLEGK